MRFPLKAVHGDALTAELAAAGVEADVYVVDDQIEVVTDAAESKVKPVLDAHAPDPDYGVPDEDRQLRLLRAKAQEVKAGTSTFTAAQVQKILAHLILRSTR